MNELTQLSGQAFWLPVIFIGLMGLAFFIYAILDGYDLGVGILLPKDSEQQRDTMIASIGPFWDANETWLVLGIGILLIAFPTAHSMILFHLYLPVTVMLAGLILRGVAFDFRAKAPADHKDLWDKVFKTGSLLASLAQGYMLGMYIMGFEQSIAAALFATLSAICVTAGYSFIGAAWLVMKTEGELQVRAARLTRKCAWLMGLGLITVSIVNPLVSDTIFQKWFGNPLMILLMVIPIFCFVLLFIVDTYLRRFPYRNDLGCWIPFASAIMIFLLSFIGLAYSFFPDVVPGKLNIWQASSAPESLMFILYGAIIVLPTIIFYTLFSYRVFWGKATQLKYH
ncbi:cytochrome d ubiquinol oxidase subunit II [Cellvibrio japonicus]|uniref:Cytochrome oxidase subunit II superfamily n=1 Tax=Cellvibrio japonicus (strain Ueda107) TaxID=498211 RepID=B3PEC5_CELJU|nr:cytochrome d ubiquinol oxidase subunit II [Cellvibrio japonicus]ACE82921.1 cytochrome oxidase subunit II superfamily [Cellvibrio japonicus Ueda107]QEI14282.1 cytochrome d ubiquinol oxidase subunit II [Cellvibrio japonicus]QEI17859.1 cytochrome d ubiquinol oxidase subunit II [Cellvibrio japonicus]QEI21434.1 cytochrome d ubiquinol oxidase subunit II [Cellvibrio japonicus]